MTTIEVRHDIGDEVWTLASDDKAVSFIIKGICLSEGLYGSTTITYRDERFRFFLAERCYGSREELTQHIFSDIDR